MFARAGNTRTTSSIRQHGTALASGILDRCREMLMPLERQMCCLVCFGVHRAAIPSTPLLTCKCLQRYNYTLPALLQLDASSTAAHELLTALPVQHALYLLWIDTVCAICVLNRMVWRPAASIICSCVWHGDGSGWHQEAAIVSQPRAVVVATQMGLRAL